MTRIQHFIGSFDPVHITTRKKCPQDREGVKLLVSLSNYENSCEII